ncbi:DNA-processing protein DprA [Terrisporobacter petrolearius]|uniref:DNA-processing protein DprA n=1 Tax=Terrisporobacter petrolearius TaxID=1460447 RepID=UPI0031CCB2A2
MNKREIYLCIESIKGLSTITLRKIIKEVGSVEAIISLSEKDIYNLKNISLNIKENLVKYISRFNLDEIKEKLYKNSIQYICIEDDEYPEKLRNIYSPPLLLFYKGDLSIINNNLNIAMVGSRKPTPYGINCAHRISYELSQVGINIISGLALGIDSCCHRGCIKGKGKTIAVLASSLDNIRPSTNEALANEILEDGGLILSEYNVGHITTRGNFPCRNRIISGISDGVIVVEAGEKSGALITADLGLDQGKNIFAVPGYINSDLSKGCHKIIKEGAKLIENIDDILNEYNNSGFNNNKNSIEYDIKDLSNEALKIIQVIKRQGMLQINEICDTTGIDIKNVNTIINELLLRDLVVEMNNKMFSIN